MMRFEARERPLIAKGCITRGAAAMTQTPDLALPIPPRPSLLAAGLHTRPEHGPPGGAINGFLWTLDNVTAEHEVRIA